MGFRETILLVKLLSRDLLVGGIKENSADIVIRSCLEQSVENHLS